MRPTKQSVLICLLCLSACTVNTPQMKETPAKGQKDGGQTAAEQPTKVKGFPNQESNSQDLLMA